MKLSTALLTGVLKNLVMQVAEGTFRCQATIEHKKGVFDVTGFGPNAITMLILKDLPVIAKTHVQAFKHKSPAGGVITTKRVFLIEDIIEDKPPAREEFNGFVIKPINSKAAVEALHVLSFYKVEFETRSDGDGGDLEIIVLRETREGDLRCAEMAFQFAFHQANAHLCPVCRAEVEGSGEGDAVCGHLVFDKPKC